MAYFVKLAGDTQYETFLTAEFCAEYIAENGISEDDFDEFLDECYEPVEVCGAHYDVSHILYHCDPILYRVALGDYADGERENILYELERMSDGESLQFYGYEVEYAEPDDDEERE